MSPTIPDENAGLTEQATSAGRCRCGTTDKIIFILCLIPLVTTSLYILTLTGPTTSEEKPPPLQP
ncbi:unnamed protein product, partial [Allacma fusca]